jgi:hypothetical protein
VKTHYQCEICLTVYEYEAQAALCEATVLEPCPIKVGDTVAIQTRYDGIAYDTAIDVIVQANECQQEALQSWSDNVEDYLERIKNNPSRFLLHEYTLVTRQSHQIGKQWFTDQIPMSSIVFEDKEGK